MRLWIEKFAWLPPLAGGLFAGRWAAFVGARLLEQRAIAPPVFALLAVALLFPTAALILWHRADRPPLRRTWFLLLALPYLLLPWEDPYLAGGTILALILAWIIQQAPDLSGKMGFLPAGLLAAAAILLYGTTLMPGVLPADSGEFQLRGAQLGVAHPTGFALYTLTAYLMTQLPLPLSAAAAVNAYSLLLATATLLLVYAAGTRLSGSRWAGVLAAASLGGSTTFWAQATTANIRMPTALLAAAAYYLLIRWTRRREPLTEQQLLLFGALMLISVTHHVSLGFMGLIFGVYVLWQDPTLLRPDRRWAFALAGAALGCLPLLYFPLRAGAPGAPDDINTLSGLLNHVLGLGFRGDLFYFQTPVALWDRTQIMANILQLQFTPLLLLGAGVGWVLLLRGERQGHRPVALLLLATFAVHLFITATYRAPQTVEYLLPAYLPLALALGHAVTLRRAGAPGVAVAALLLTMAAGQVWTRYPSYRELRQWDDTTGYTNVILEEAPPDSVVLAGWHWATPLWYRQEIEGIRRDLDVRYVFPTDEPYAATWARRVEEALAENRPVVATHRFPDTYSRLPAWTPLGEALLFSQERSPAAAPMREMDAVFGDVIALRGIDVPAAVAPGETMAVEIAWETLRPLDRPTTLFIHLVDESGAILVQADAPVDDAAARSGLSRLTLTPRPGTAPGAYTLLAGAYRSGAEGIEALPVAGGAERVPLPGTVRVTAAKRAPFTTNPTYRPLLEEARTLIGYDWDNTDPTLPRLYLHWQHETGFTSTVADVPDGRYTLPPWRGAAGLPRRGTGLENDGGYYVPFGQGIVWTGPLLPDGATMSPGAATLLRQQFQAGRPLVRDVAVSARLVGYEEDRFTWAWAVLDEAFGVPAMGAIPTLKWIEGMAVLDLHRLTVPESAEAGQESGALLNLYDTFTNRPVPVLDERFNPATPWRTTTVTP